MTTNTLDFQEFKSSSRKDWEAVVSAQLKNKTVEDLKWFSDEFGLSSYQDYADDVSTDYLRLFFESLTYEWKQYELVHSSDADANAKAMQALNRGCHGVIFQLEDSWELNNLTKGILFEHCEVNFVIDAVARLPELQEFCSVQMVNGFVLNALDPNKQLPFLDRMWALVTRIRQVEENTLWLEPSDDFFLELAGIRALRYLHGRIRSIQGHATSSLWIHSHLIQQGTIERSVFSQTTRGLAAILGGADSLSFAGVKGHIATSRNIGNLLRDESGLHKNQDLVKGSYFLDNLTDQIIRTIWDRIQQEW